MRPPRLKKRSTQTLPSSSRPLPGQVPLPAPGNGWPSGSRPVPQGVRPAGRNARGSPGSSRPVGGGVSLPSAFSRCIFPPHPPVASSRFVTRIPSVLRLPGGRAITPRIPAGPGFRPALCGPKPGCALGFSTSGLCGTTFRRRKNAMPADRGRKSANRPRLVAKGHLFPRKRIQ